MKNQPYESPQQLAELRTDQHTLAGMAVKRVVANKKAVGLLVEAGAFDEDQKDDYMGLRSFSKLLRGLPAGDHAADMAKGVEQSVRIAGVMRDRSARSYAEARAARMLRDGQDPSDAGPISNARRDTFVRLSLEDDTGTVYCSVNRFDYGGALKKELDSAREGDIIIVEGDKRSGRRSVDVRAVEIAYRQQPDGSYVHVDSL